MAVVKRLKPVLLGWLERGFEGSLVENGECGSWEVVVEKAGKKFGNEGEIYFE